MAGPAAGRLGRDIVRRRLDRFLDRSLHEPMIGLVAAASLVIEGNPAPLGSVPDLPREALGADMRSPHYIAPWTLETLVNELLATPKAKGFSEGRTRVIRHDRFEVLQAMARLIAALENKEDRLYLDEHDVFTEMGRIAQRQFPWQRGFATASALYRSVLLFGSGSAAEEFERSVGLPVQAFVKVGAWLAGALQRSDWTPRTTDLTAADIDADQREAALRRLSIGHADARTLARRLRGGRRHVAYRPSVLRDHPVIAFGAQGERLRAPIPSLITPRFTSGLYLDVIGGGGAVWKEIGERFELYCLEYLASMMSPYDVRGELEYGPKKARSRSPDILVSRDGEIVLLAECKAKRMSFDARFADEPYESAKASYDELAKGVFQIWRFRSHVRRGLVEAVSMSQDCVSAILTIDPWLTMARNEELRVLERANRMADEAGEIGDDDRCAVPVIPIDDVEFVLQQGDAASLLDAIRAISCDQRGWMLSAAHAADLHAVRPYPFTDRISEHLPWWRPSSDAPRRS